MGATQHRTWHCLGCGSSMTRTETIATGQGEHKRERCIECGKIASDLASKSGGST